MSRFFSWQTCGRAWACSCQYAHIMIHGDMMVVTRDGTQMDMSLLQWSAIAIDRSQMCCLMPAPDIRVGGNISLQLIPAGQHVE